MKLISKLFSVPTFGACAAVAVLFAAVVVLVGPTGDFPLSDDWAFAWAARTLCEDGSIQILPWTGATMVLQAAWGALACRIAGFSFDVLRATTLATSFLTLIAVTATLAYTRRNRSSAIFVGSAILFNPLFLNLSFTFMTDVPFTALATTATVLAAASGATPIAAGLVAAAATLVRQPGLAVAFALAAGALLKPDGGLRGWRWNSAGVLWSAVPATAALVFWALWLASTQQAPAAVSNKLAEALAISPLTVGNVGVRALLYLGLLLAPITLAIHDQLGPRARLTGIAAGVIATGFIVFFYMRQTVLMPLLPNLIYDFGLGALTTRDTLYMESASPTAIGIFFSLSMTALSVLGVARLAAIVIALGPRLLDGHARWFTLAATAVFAVSFLQSAYYFDRYLLPVSVLSTVALALAASRLRPGLPALAALAAFALFSIGGTHDYMAWNRARHALVEDLGSRGVGFDKLDAGMDLNGWHNAHRLGTWPSDEDVIASRSGASKSWWWVMDDEWVVSFRPLRGYEPVASRPWVSWLGLASHSVLASRRLASDD
ncbi:MAG: hypothetical protein ACI8TX_002111 [Hyphomicrobiaceae bacterium]|jgi:hypothetical protein